MKENNNPEMKLHVVGTAEEMYSIGSRQFNSALENSGFSTEVVHEVKAQLSELEKGLSENFLFVFSDGVSVITGIYVKDSMVNQENEPMLFAGATKNSVIAAFSKSFIQNALNDAIDCEIPGEMQAGLEEPHEYAWAKQIEIMGELTKKKMKTHPPKAWADTLKIPDNWTEEN